MKKLILTAALVAGTFTSVFAAGEVVAPKVETGFLANPNFQIVKEEKISENLRSLSMNIKVMGPNGPEVRPVKAFAGVIDGKEYVMTGTVYGPDGQVLKIPLDKGIVDAGTAWTFGEGAEELYLVTNPSCSWCSKFEKQVHDGNNAEFFKKYKVHVILMPFGAGAEEKAKWVLSATTDAERAERYTALMVNGDSTWTSFKPTDVVGVNLAIEKSNAAAKEMGATGTPAIFDAEFNQIKNWPALLK